MSEILSGIEGVVCLVDDILVYGDTQEQHDEQLVKVLNRLLQANITLNKEKCRFSQDKVNFLGQAKTEYSWTLRR